MAYAFDVDSDGVTAWRLTGEGDTDGRATSGGARPDRDTDYQPTIYAHAEGGSNGRSGRQRQNGDRGGNGGAGRALDALADRLDDDPKVADLRWVDRYLDLHADSRTEVLAVDVERVREVGTLAREVRERHEQGRAPGTFRLYNVDFSPGFRYCVETGTNPSPSRDLRTLAVRTTDRALAHGDLTELRIDGEPIAGSEDAVLGALATRIERVDPDVLVVSHGGLLELAAGRASEAGVDLQWGRETASTETRGVTQLSGANTYGSYGRTGHSHESYGHTGHSPARYTVPGRAVLDESNSFLWGRSGLAGLRYLVGQSWKPIEEAGWASIGNVLTAMQTREAFDRDVLVPWNKWEPEQFKDARTLHAADRGGMTLAPEVGHHEDVYAVDFASLYPRIICEYNVSPDTVGCDCHPDGEVVPELGYNVCPEDGFLGDVLEPLLEDRRGIKADLQNIETDRRNAAADDRERLAAKSAAIKWVLVSCFGYQGYRNSKFGRIECHEAINAYARDILLQAKTALEDAGWPVVHAIVDSIWVTPDDDPEPLEVVCERISEDVRVRLERDGDYDWVCFVPRRGGSGRRAGGGSGGRGSDSGSGGGGRSGALTSYFGKVAGEDEFTVRGVEARRRSTPAFVADSQREWLRALDRGGPDAVVDALSRDLAAVRAGDVALGDLAITRRASKPASEYRRETRAVAALRRYEANGVERHPGQSVEYVVVDDDADGRRRVRLPFEDCSDYDVDYYVGRLVDAAETVLSPFEWTRARIERELRGSRDVTLSSF